MEGLSYTTLTLMSKLDQLTKELASLTGRFGHVEDFLVHKFQDFKPFIQKPVRVTTPQDVPESQPRQQIKLKSLPLTKKVMTDKKPSFPKEDDDDSDVCMVLDSLDEFPMFKETVSTSIKSQQAKERERAPSGGSDSSGSNQGPNLRKRVKQMQDPNGDSFYEPPSSYNNASAIAAAMSQRTRRSPTNPSSNLTPRQPLGGKIIPRGSFTKIGPYAELRMEGVKNPYRPLLIHPPTQGRFVPNLLKPPETHHEKGSSAFPPYQKTQNKRNSTEEKVKDEPEIFGIQTHSNDEFEVNVKTVIPTRPEEEEEEEEEMDEMFLQRNNVILVEDSASLSFGDSGSRSRRKESHKLRKFDDSDPSSPIDTQEEEDDDLEDPDKIKSKSIIHAKQLPNFVTTLVVRRDDKISPNKGPVLTYEEYHFIHSHYNQHQHNTTWKCVFHDASRPCPVLLITTPWLPSSKSVTLLRILGEGHNHEMKKRPAPRWRMANAASKRNATTRPRRPPNNNVVIKWE